MDTTEQAEKQKKIKRRNIIVGIVLFGVVIIGAVWWSVAAGNSARPEYGTLPCKKDWDPVQVDAAIQDDPYEYVGQCFEIEGTVEVFSDRNVYLRSDTGGHTYLIVTENMPSCVMGNIAEGSRVSASAYFQLFPNLLRNHDGTLTMLFGCDIPNFAVLDNSR